MNLMFSMLGVLLHLMGLRGVLNSKLLITRELPAFGTHLTHPALKPENFSMGFLKRSSPWYNSWSGRGDGRL